MRLLVKLLLCSLALATACATEPLVDNEPLPEWLTELIQELESQPVANPPAFITRFNYKGQEVYYLPPRCCDIGSNLYNSDGIIICHPDGGFSGDGVGLCPDFFAERKKEEIIWRDPRGAT